MYKLVLNQKTARITENHPFVFHGDGFHCNLFYLWRASSIDLRARPPRAKLLLRQNFLCVAWQVLLESTAKKAGTQSLCTLQTADMASFLTPAQAHWPSVQLPSANSLSIGKNANENEQIWNKYQVSGIRPLFPSLTTWHVSGFPST